MNKTGWLSRDKTSAAVILGLCVFSVFSICFSLRIPGLSPAEKHDENFTIIQRHYGIDAAEMERSAAIPLEDALARIRGMKEIRSVSENGAVRVLVRFEGKSAGRYEAVREAAQEIYKELPSSAQRPEILSSDGSRVPVWTAAVTLRGNSRGAPPGNLLEKTVKPALEALDGAGEAEISGAPLTEIIIAIDERKAALIGLNPRDTASALAHNDALFSGGILAEKKNGREIEVAVVIDGRYENLQALKSAVIPVRGNGETKLVVLEDIASIREEEKENQSLSRLNGKKTAIIAVMAGGRAGNADLGKLSRLIKREIGKFGELEFTVLSDRGSEESAAYRSVLAASIQGSLAVAVMTALLCRGKDRPALFPVCAFSVPVIILFSAALLVILGFELDKPVLAGLSAGAGAAVDAVILGAEYLGTPRRFTCGRKALAALSFPLVSGSATTIIALLPLGLRKSAPGFSSVAWAAGSINFTAMILSLTLFPPLFLRCAPAAYANNRVSPGRPRNFFKFHFRRHLSRFFAFHIRFCLKRPCAIMVFWLLLSVLGAAALFTRGTDTGGQGSSESVFAQIEFEGGLCAEETDRILAAYGESLKKNRGVVNVQTGARTGSGSVLLTFDPAVLDEKKAKKLLRSCPIPGGFAYIGESSGGERIWEIRISGDDGKRCRELAAEAARICAAVPLAEETILNFKEGRARLTLTPDRERGAETGVSLSLVGGILRYEIHGPVAYKRINPGGETDVRFRWENPKAAETGRIFSAREKIRNSPIPGKSPASGTFFTEKEDREPSSIQRVDRRRSASISIRTKVVDPGKARDSIMPALSRLELPPGYGIEFDPGALKAAGDVSGSAVLFVLALVFCYMVIAASRESFFFPFAVLAVVPPSLAVPALCMIAAGCPLNAASAAAFVAVSGMAINAAVLTAEDMPAANLYRILRKKLPLLAATTATTVLGAAPFLFIRNSPASLVKSLSLVAALGVTASAVCSFSLIPALAQRFPGMFQRFSVKC